MDEFHSSDYHAHCCFPIIYNSAACLPDKMYNLIARLLITECSSKLDIMILIDRSGYSADDWRTTQEGIISLVETIDNKYQVYGNGTNIGVAFYDDVSVDVLNIDRGTSVTRITEAILSMESMNGGSHNLEEALSSVGTQFVEHSRSQTIGGENTFMVCIVIINTPMSNEVGTIHEATQLMLENINIIPIPISKSVSLEPVQQIATNPDNVAYTPYQSLHSLWTNVDDLRKMVCPPPGMYIIPSCMIQYHWHT